MHSTEVKNEDHTYRNDRWRGFLAATAAVAQNSTTSPMPAPRAGVDTKAPLPGANSFTEEQARARLRDQGYGNPEHAGQGR